MDHAPLGIELDVSWRSRIQAAQGIPHALTEIRIEAVVHPTEDPSKVRAAILSIFPDAMFTETGVQVQARTSSLDRLKELFRKQVIRDTARRLLRASLAEDGLRFSLNKQTAFMGRANFAPPSPMGAINVTILDSDPSEVIDFLTGKSNVDAPRSASDAER